MLYVKHTIKWGSQIVSVYLDIPRMEIWQAEAYRKRILPYIAGGKAMEVVV